MHYNIINNKNQLHEKAKDITLGIGCRISYGARCAGSGDDWGALSRLKILPTEWMWFLKRALVHPRRGIILCLGTFKNQAIPVRQSNQSLLLRSEYNGLS